MGKECDSLLPKYACRNSNVLYDWSNQRTQIFPSFFSHYTIKHLASAANMNTNQKLETVWRVISTFIYIHIYILVIIAQNVFQFTTDNTYKRIGYSLGFERMCGYVMHVITCWTLVSLRVVKVFYCWAYLYSLNGI